MKVSMSAASNPVSGESVVKSISCSLLSPGLEGKGDLKSFIQSGISEDEGEFGSFDFKLKGCWAMVFLEDGPTNKFLWAVRVDGVGKPVSRVWRLCFVARLALLLGLGPAGLSVFC